MGSLGGGSRITAPPAARGGSVNLVIATTARSLPPGAGQQVKRAVNRPRSSECSLPVTLLWRVASLRSRDIAVGDPRASDVGNELDGLAGNGCHGQVVMVITQHGQALALSGSSDRCFPVRHFRGNGTA